MFPNEIVDCLHLVGNRTNNPYGFRLRLFCVWLLWPSCVFGDEQRYGQKEQLFSEICRVTDKVVDENPVLQVVRVTSDRILPDTLTIGYQLLYYDYDRGYCNGEEYDVKSYFVVEEGKGEPVSDTVKLAAKRIYSESRIDLEGLEFVEIGK